MGSTLLPVMMTPHGRPAEAPAVLQEGGDARGPRWLRHQAGPLDQQAHRRDQGLVTDRHDLVDRARASSNASAMGRVIARPSAIVCAGRSTTRRAATDSAIAGALRTVTPMMRVLGEAALSHDPTPATSAPSPIWTSMTSSRRPAAVNSWAIVPAPAAISTMPAVLHQRGRLRPGRGLPGRVRLVPAALDELH